MPAGAPGQVVRPSVFDRLTGNVPKGVPGPQLAVGIRELKRTVGQDLEWLLNSTVWLPWDLARSEELASSHLTFGLPDLSVYTWISERDGRSVQDAIERAIRDHEPRLAPASVRVTLLDRQGVDDFRVRFRIEAVLQVEPVSERVTYDSHVDFGSRQVKVERAG